MTTERNARYIMIGGFLGAGKTTVVAKLARHLVNSGKRVGLITNDQGRELAIIMEKKDASIALALSLPKKVPCETPGRTCSVLGPGQRACRPTDMEPFGVYLIERVTGRDLPIAYSTELDCD